MRRALQLFLGIVFLGGAAYVFVLTTGGSTEFTPRENTMLNGWLTLLSVLGSGFLSHVFGVTTTREATENKINTIALQSSEKILNLSTQLWRLEQFIEESLERASAEPTSAVTLAVLTNRLVSTSYMARILRASNNTLLSDWKGVVSADIKGSIEEQIRGVSDIIDGYAEIDAARAEDVDAVSDEELNEQLEAKLKEIRSRRQQLPAAVAPDLPAPRPAVSIRQFTTEAGPESQNGKLQIRILRSVSNATGSGKLEPRMSASPRVTVRLRSSPMPESEVHTSVGVGTTYDFNIHMKPAIPGGRLKPGVYEFDYAATVASS